MDALTDRAHYRTLVADIAAKAKAILPEAVNGRVESAVKLVLGGDVEPQGDGSILVGSSTDPLKTYRLLGPTCECQDFTRGQAPEGWCQHRIAAGIQKRVGELVPQSTAVETAAPAGPFPEAPASVNVRLQVEGREVQLTLRDSDETRLLARLQVVLAQYPVPQPPAQPQGQDWCARHQVAMKLNTKNGRSWYSHRVPSGEFCKGGGGL